MALTPSNMLPIGTQAPDFTLLDVTTGKDLSLSTIKGQRGTLVMFICNHCPYVVHIEKELIRIGKDYKSSELSVIAISSNDVDNYPDDSPEKMKERASINGYEFPYLYDETQMVAKSYQAACTPDFFLFDADLKLVYRGQLDDSRPSNGVPVTGKDLRSAINALLVGRPVSSDQKPSMGCNIKWISR